MRIGATRIAAETAALQSAAPQPSSDLAMEPPFDTCSDTPPLLSDVAEQTGNQVETHDDEHYDQQRRRH